MNTKLLLALALVLSLVFTGCATAPSNRSLAISGGVTPVDKDLAEQISDVLKDCKKIKPGMTRAELLTGFSTEGGIWTATHRTFVYRRCPYIKVDVDFALSDPKQERPSDIISKISKPYLDWSIID